MKIKIKFFKVLLIEQKKISTIPLQFVPSPLDRNLNVH